MNVEGKTYCIDDDGIVHYGWVKLSTTTPEIRGYKYFYEPESENDQTLVLGEEAESIWLEIEGPDDLSSGTREWYYFDNNGYNYRNRWVTAVRPTLMKTAMRCRRFAERNMYLTCTGRLSTAW